MAKSTYTTDVVIAGGGPAGLMAALLLSRQGAKVLVLEKNRDFSREYRGEVLMPRFTQMFQQLHLDSWLETLPHLKLKFGQIYLGEKLVGKINFSHASKAAPYAVWLSQPVLLQALHELALKDSHYELWFGSQVKHLIKEGDTVTGVEVQKGNELIEVKARVTIGADGRYSTVFKEGNFEIEYEDYRFDVLWFSIPKPPGYENTFKVMLSPKRSLLFLPKYPDSIQVGLLVPPHELNEMRKEGIETIRQELREATPLLHEFADGLKDFTAFHPLQAHLHMVKHWATNGCLLIGDSAHCCSPAGAIGVSMAVGTSIVAADVIGKALKKSSGVLSADQLSEVQKIREDDVRMVHRIQRAIGGGALNRIVPVNWLLPILIMTLARTPLFRVAQRRLMALRKLLPISPELTKCSWGATIK